MIILPKVKLNQQEYMINDFFKDLLWECKKAGFTQAQQAEEIGCSQQNINYLYSHQSMSVKQYLIIRSKLDEIKNREGG